MSTREAGAAVDAEFDPFAGPELALAVPTTASQREIWTAAQLGDEASCCFDESISLRLRGALDAAALRGALDDLVARHEALRATFSADGTTLCVAARLEVDLPLLDLSGDAPGAREAGLARALREAVERPFELERGPLLRALLVRLAADAHVLVLTAHHAVCDGWSTALVVRDLARLYSARRAGRRAELPPAFPFSAYARELADAAAGPEHAEAERYWLDRFAALPPALDLPVDRRRPPLRSFASARVDTALGPDVVQALRRAAARTGGSAFHVLLAGFQALLHRLTGQEDLVVGVPAAGQASSGHADLVGHCVNTLAVRARVDPAASFAEAVAGARTAVLDAFEHQQLGFGELVARLSVPRDPSRLPLVSVMFNLDQRLPPDALRFEGLQAELDTNPRSFENFELFLNVVDLGDAYRLEWQLNTDLLDPATVERWARCYETLLRAAAEDPGAAVARLPVLAAADRAAVDAWNAASALAFDRDQPAHALVERQVARAPDAVALVHGDAAVTYGALDARANRLARRLRALGVGPGARVGLHLERSPEMVVALLAVSKAGGAYVPLDPAYPPERLAFMLADARATVLVTEEALRGRLQPGGAAVLCVDADRAAIDAESDAPLPPAPGASPEDPLYVIYTSGSTGKPKGVAVPHRAVANLLASTRERPGMAPGDVIVAITTLSFDIAVFELWLPLTVGARIVLAGRDAAGDGAQLLELVRRHRATVLQATPATWRVLLAAGWSAADRLKVISTGEALPLDLAEELVERSADVWNMYGPTETTVWSSWYRVPRPVGPTMLIGRPVANTQLHVLDRHLEPVPVGVPGELYIGGDGVALGYLERPELTAERFLPDPFRPGGRLYRTGDVARWRASGEVEYLGRNDHQVKVRGFRIELGEIEAQLARQPAVAQAVVVAREDRPGDVRLVAYAVARPGAALDGDAIRGALRAALPEYMVPQHVVALPALPLTPNGKVDRKALPAPDAGAAHALEYVAPRTEAERVVAELWQQALGVARIGVHDDFFALGGHSLLAAQVSARLAREHGVAVPMRRLFEAPTVAQFARHVAGARATARIPRLADDGPAPVSFMQERTWNLAQLHGPRAAFNLPSAFRLEGPLDAGALARSLQAFVDRHEAVRTTLAAHGAGVVQVVAPQLAAELPVEDLRGHPAETREQALMDALLAESARPFDLERGPLFRARLYRLADDAHVVFFMPHHAIWDGWSFDVLVRDWAELYAAEREGRAPALPALPVRYRDFAAWHRAWLQSPEVEQQAGWWRRQLAGPIAPLELPADQPRTRSAGDAGATLWVEIPRAEADALAALAQRHGATLFMAVLAAYVAALHRFSGQEDVLVGTPVRGRSQPELEDLVGTFINTLVLRTRLDGDPSFAELLGRVRGTVRDAFAHEDVPFELLAMSDKPIYRALFSYQDARGRPARFGDLQLAQVHVLPPVAANDVSLWVMERDAGLVGGLNFSTALFSPATMEGFLASVRALLRAAVADPGCPLSRLDAACEPDRAGALREAGPAVLPARFLARAAADPGAPALAGAGEALSAGALRDRAAGVAARLAAAGVERGVRVALLAPTAADRALGALAIALSGGVCVPIDPSDPPARAAALLRRVRARVVLAPPGAEMPEDAETVLVPLDSASGSPPLPAGRGAGGEGGIPCLLAPGDLAALLLEPAGDAAKVTWAALSAAVEGARTLLGVGPGDVVLASGGEHALLEAWLALDAGARLAWAPEVEDDPDLLPDALERAGATVLLAPARTWTRLLAAGWRGGPAFKAVCTEPAPAALAADLAAAAGAAFALHGAPGAALAAGVARLEPGAPGGLLGEPLPGVRWRVADARLRPVPRGVPGELLVAGDVLARGHVGDEGAAATRLAPAAAGEPGPWLRTGVRARALGDGRLVAVGRRDALARVRGRWVDPLEVERALAEHPAIAAAAVVAVDDGEGGARLVAHVVRRPGGDTTDTELRAHLRARLPAAAVPRGFVELEALPMRDGAVDRAALATGARPAAAAHLEPRTGPERLLAELWREALGVPRVGLQDNFFDLGGHSLLCLQLVAQIERRTGTRLSPRALLLDTLEQVAGRLAAERGPAEGAAR